MIDPVSYKVSGTADGARTFDLGIHGGLGMLFTFNKVGIEISCLYHFGAIPLFEDYYTEVHNNYFSFNLGLFTDRGTKIIRF